CSLSSSAAPPDPPPFPTRRSSDLQEPRSQSAALPSPTRRPTAAAIVSAGLSSPVAFSGALSRRWRFMPSPYPGGRGRTALSAARSEEHTSELQSRENLVCRLLLEK